MRKVFESWEEKQNQILSELKKNPGKCYHSISGVYTNPDGLDTYKATRLLKDLKDFDRRKKAFENGNKYLIFHKELFKNMLRNIGIEYLFLRYVGEKGLTHFEVSKSFSSYFRLKHYSDLNPEETSLKEVPKGIYGSLLFWYLMFSISSVVLIMSLVFKLHHTLNVYSLIALFLSFVMINIITKKRRIRRRKIREIVSEITNHKFKSDLERRNSLFLCKEDRGDSGYQNVFCYPNDFENRSANAVRYDENKETLSEAASLAAKHHGRVVILTFNFGETTKVSMAEKEPALHYDIAELGVEIGNMVIFLKKWRPNESDAYVNAGIRYSNSDQYMTRYNKDGLTTFLGN